MKLKFLLVIAAALVSFAPAALAQHTVNMSWTLSTSDVTANCAAAGTCHQTVYRAPGACSATSSFISLAVISATQATYSDTNVPSGSWCYGLSFSDAGGESVIGGPPLTVSLQAPKPPAPTGLKTTSTT